MMQIFREIPIFRGLLFVVFLFCFLLLFFLQQSAIFPKQNNLSPKLGVRVTDELSVTTVTVDHRTKQILWTTVPNRSCGPRYQTDPVDHRTKQILWTTVLNLSLIHISEPTRQS